MTHCVVWKQPLNGRLFQVCSIQAEARASAGAAALGLTGFFLLSNISFHSKVSLAQNQVVHVL